MIQKHAVCKNTCEILRQKRKGVSEKSHEELQVTSKLEQKETAIPKEPSHEAKVNKQEIAIPKEPSHEPKQNKQETAIPKEPSHEPKQNKQATAIPKEPSHQVKTNKYENAALTALTAIKAHDSSTKELKLDPRGNVTVEMLKEFGLALKNNSHVKSVFLNDINMTDEGAKVSSVQHHHY